MNIFLREAVRLQQLRRSSSEGRFLSWRVINIQHYSSRCSQFNDKECYYSKLSWFLADLYCERERRKDVGVRQVCARKLTTDVCTVLSQSILNQFVCCTDSCPVQFEGKQSWSWWEGVCFLFFFFFLNQRQTERLPHQSWSYICESHCHYFSFYFSRLEVCVCGGRVYVCVCVLTHALVKWIQAIGKQVAANWVAPDASSTWTCTPTPCVCVCVLALPSNLFHTHQLSPERECNWLLWVPSSFGLTHKPPKKPAGSV